MNGQWSSHESSRACLSSTGASGLKAGTSLTLSIPKAKAIPEDIGAITDDLWTLDQKMRMANLSIAVGTLTAN